MTKPLATSWRPPAHTLAPAPVAGGTDPGVPRSRFSALEAKAFEDVRNRRPGRSGLANGFYVHGEVATREAFLERARLRAVADEERSQTLGFIAEWRSTPRARRQRSVRDLYRPVHAANLHRREFRSEELLRRWADRAARADLSLLRWRGYGSVVEVEASPKSAGDQQPAL